MNKLRICLPAKVFVDTRLAQTLLETLTRLQPVCKYAVEHRMMCGKSNIDHARSMMVSDFYRDCSDMDLCLLIDSDTLFSVNDILRAINLIETEPAASTSAASASASTTDIVAGVVPTQLGTGFFQKKEGSSDELLYASASFMMFRKKALVPIFKFLEQEGVSDVRISAPDYNHVTPFFKQRIIRPTEKNTRAKWLNDSAAFCFLARLTGSTIRGFTSKTLTSTVAVAPTS